MPNIASPQRWLPLLAGLTLMALAVTGCLPENSEREDALAALARWEDVRLAPQDSLTMLLRHDDAHVRLAAVRSAGLIGRSDVLPEMLTSLQDKSPTVVRQAAFSLGLLGDDAAVTALEQTARDPHASTRVAALRGLAHLSHSGQAFLDAAASRDGDEAVAAWDGMRNLATEMDSTALSQALLAGLARPETDILWRVLRCCERTPWPPLLPAIAPHAQSDNPQVRVHAYRALARFDSLAALSAVIEGGRHSGSFGDRHADRVEVALLRACGSLGHLVFSLPEETSQPDRDFLLTALITGAGHANPHVAVTALAAMQNLVADLPLPPEAADQESLLPVWRIRMARAAGSHLDHQVPDVRAAAIMARALLRGDGASAQILDILTEATQPLIQAASLQALGEVQANPLPTLLRYARPEEGYSPRVRVAALNALMTAASKEPSNKQDSHQGDEPSFRIEQVRNRLLAAAGSPDFVEATTAAGHLGKFPHRRSIAALTDLWNEASGPEASDLKLGVLEALKTMGSEIVGLGVPDSLGTIDDPLLDQARKVLTEAFAARDIRIRYAGKETAEATGLLADRLIPSRGSLLATLPAQQRSPLQAPLRRPFDAGEVVCVTDKGEFTITLDGRTAPNTCATFLQLIQEGYYDGLTFHRVVPDFVVQGGCPRGDGWGGPGFTIRSEWSRLRYTRAAVGIAHSGKDTGGSQFFVTLSEQPHLNGRYTIFGQVTKGMEVVDQLVVTDSFRLELKP